MLHFRHVGHPRNVPFGDIVWSGFYAAVQTLQNSTPNPHLSGTIAKNTPKWVPQKVLKLRFGLLCGLLVASLWPLGGLEVPGTPQNTALHDFLRILVAFGDVV